MRILELRSVFGTGGGPEKTILLGTARTDPARFEITVCYIRDERDTVFGIGDWAASLPIRYSEVRERHSLDPRPLRELRRLVTEREIDIVHAHDYKTDLIAWLLARSGSVVPLITAHGWTGHSTKERWVYYPGDRWLMRRFPRVIAVSSEIKRVLVAGGAEADRITVVTNGIDGTKFRRDPARVPAVREALGLRADDLVLGAVGRLEPQKNFPLLLRVFAALSSSRPALRLVLVGDGSKRQALQAQAAALGLRNSCLITGHRTDVADLYQAFDLYVQSSDYEGTPNTVLEAMAFEAPVVATAAGGTADIARDGEDGWIVPVGDEPALTAAITDALDRPEERRRRARSARCRVETDLSFETRMQRVEAIYDELIAERDRHQ